MVGSVYVFLHVLSYVHNFRSYDHIYAYPSSLNINGKFTQHKIDQEMSQTDLMQH